MTPPKLQFKYLGSKKYSPTNLEFSEAEIIVAGSGLMMIWAAVYTKVLPVTESMQLLARVNLSPSGLGNGIHLEGEFENEKYSNADKVGGDAYWKINLLQSTHYDFRP